MEQAEPVVQPVRKAAHLQLAALVELVHLAVWSRLQQGLPHPVPVGHRRQSAEMPVQQVQVEAVRPKDRQPQATGILHRLVKVVVAVPQVEARE